MTPFALSAAGLDGLDGVRHGFFTRRGGVSGLGFRRFLFALLRLELRGQSTRLPTPAFLGLSRWTRGSAKHVLVLCEQLLPPVILLDVALAVLAQGACEIPVGKQEVEGLFELFEISIVETRIRLAAVVDEHR